MEDKIKKLSNTIVNYSLEVKENDRVLITVQTNEPNRLVKYLILKKWGILGHLIQ